MVVAKRLCDTAAEGSTLVSDVVRLLAGPGQSMTDRVEVSLKGLNDPEVAWRVP